MTVRLLHGDCRDVLRTLPDKSVQCVVTSPPYFGLRDYGTARWDGGDPACDHIERSARDVGASNGLGRIPGYRDSLPMDNAAFKAREVQFKACCGKCGAQRIDSQIGLEATPDDFVSAMIQVFGSVRRVLRDDGTLWLNLGDSYFNTQPGSGGKCVLPGAGRAMREARYHDGKRSFDGTGLKPKDLLGIPWRVAFALQADGWYLRSDIIWHKPNPMPESVTDRPTSAHEHIFLFAKNERYFFDNEAVREPHSRDWWNETPSRPGNPDRQDGGGRQGSKESAGRNIRNVWTVATQPYSGAHFATFPPALIEPCIKAGSRPGDTVLDPFGGAGTTGLVADRLGRSAILIDLNPAYVEMIETRIRDDAGMFASLEISA